MTAFLTGTARSCDVSSYALAQVAAGLFSNANLPLITGHAGIHVNNDASGEADPFVIVRGSGSMTFLEIAENSSGTPEMTVNGNFIANGATKNVRIQHPTTKDKVLNHHAAESSEVLNTYSGTVTLNEHGQRGRAVRVVWPDQQGPPVHAHADRGSGPAASRSRAQTYHFMDTDLPYAADSFSYRIEEVAAGTGRANAYLPQSCNQGLSLGQRSLEGTADDGHFATICGGQERLSGQNGPAARA